MEFYFGLHSVMNTNLEAVLVQRKYVNQQIISSVDEMKCLPMFSLTVAGCVWRKADKLCVYM